MAVVRLEKGLQAQQGGRPGRGKVLPPDPLALMGSFIPVPTSQIRVLSLLLVVVLSPRYFPSHGGNFLLWPIIDSH